MSHQQGTCVDQWLLNIIGRRLLLSEVTAIFCGVCSFVTTDLIGCGTNRLLRVIWTKLRAVMPQSHPTTDPLRFLSPVRFLASNAKWIARRNFTSVQFSWSHHATGLVRLDTAVHLRFGRMIRRTPLVPRAMPVRASYRPRTGILIVFFNILQRKYTFVVCKGESASLKANQMKCLKFELLDGGTGHDPYGTLKGAARHPYGHVNDLTQPELTKIPHGHRMWPYGAHTEPARSPQGPFTGCLLSINPCGARKLIMHALMPQSHPTTGPVQILSPVRFLARNAPVTSHSRAPDGLFSGCFEQKSRGHSRGPHGSRAAPPEFCLPARGP